MTMIRFSIITVTFQAAKVCERTFDSVLKQRYTQVEHIIIDGVSTDGTVALAETYAQKNDTEKTGHVVHFISEPDKGLYDAMNKGIEMATGDYLVFLNAGDVFPSESTLEQIAECVLAGEEMPAVLYGDTDIVDEDGRFLRHRRLSPSEDLSWRSFKYGMLVCHQAFYARTDIAKSTPYYIKYKYSADVDWCIRIMKKAAQRQLPLRYINSVVVNYLDGGMSIQNHRASLKERFHVMVSHYGWFQTIIMHGWFLIRSFIR